MRDNETEASRIDLDLDRLARRAYDLREIDERWRTIARHVDAARSVARSMMSKKDIEATHG